MRGPRCLERRRLRHLRRAHRKFTPEFAQMIGESQATIDTFEMWNDCTAEFIRNWGLKYQPNPPSLIHNGKKRSKK